MRVLIACECSGIVRRAFRTRGHDAWSCDLKPAEDGSAHHYHTSIKQIFRNWRLWDAPRPTQWDFLIAHPDCTFLSASGLHRTVRKLRPLESTIEALDFVNFLIDAPIKKLCIENPVGFLSRAIRKPDQIIHPYDFGEDASKRTCLWLRGLEPLKPTRYVEPRIVNGKPRWANQTDSGQNRLGPSPTRAADRARTYQGIADAMAEQWGN